MSVSDFVPTAGDIILCRVRIVTNSFVHVNALAKNSSVLRGAYTGKIHQSQLTHVSEIKDKIKTFKAFAPSDYLLARVLTVNDNVLTLSTAEEGLGKLNEQRLIGAIQAHLPPSEK